MLPKIPFEQFRDAKDCYSTAVFPSTDPQSRGEGIHSPWLDDRNLEGRE